MIYTDGLETERLITRFLKPDDAVIWVEFFSDPVNVTYLANPNMLSKEERAQEMVNFTLKRYEENRFGLQALMLKETGAFIGICGLLLQELNGKNEIEIGYHLLRRFWGKGYASEAAQKFRDYGFDTHVADTIISIIHPLNVPSKNVAIRNGMTLSERGATFRDHEYDIFRISRKEWEHKAAAGSGMKLK